MSLGHHLKLAGRVLLRRKGFTAVSLFTIAATLLVVSTAAALLDEVFGTRPPESRLDRAGGLLAMGSYGERGGQSSGPGYGFLDRHMRSLPGVAEQSFFTVPNRAAAYVDGEKVNLFVKRTDGAFWRVFDLRFLEGAPFTDDDERGEAEALTALHDLRDAIDVDDSLLELVAVERFILFTRISHRRPQNWRPASRAASASALIRP